MGKSIMLLVLIAGLVGCSKAPPPGAPVGRSESPNLVDQMLYSVEGGSAPIEKMDIYTVPNNGGEVRVPCVKSAEGGECVAWDGPRLGRSPS